MKPNNLPDGTRLCQNPDCSNVVEGRVTKVYCDTPCQIAAKNAKRIKIKTKTCVVCNNEFPTTDAKRIVCSDKCKSQHDQNKLDAHNKELHEFIAKSRFEFIELTNDEDREDYADKLIDDFCSNYKVEQAFWLVEHKKTAQFITEFVYDPLPTRLTNAKRKDHYVVALVEEYNLEKDMIIAVPRLFYNNVPPVTSIQKVKTGTEIRNCLVPLRATFAGAWKTKGPANDKLEELKRILDYDDERTALFMEARVIKHDLFDAVVYTEELKKYTDVFVFTEQRSKSLYGDTLFNYKKSLQPNQLATITFTDE